MPAELFYAYKIRFRNLFLDSSDQFTVSAGSDGRAVGFETEDAALDKAESLGLNLDRIQVVRFRQNQD